MGATWAMKSNYTSILLPDFAFSDIKGCVDTTQIGIKLDDPDIDTVNYRLGELKDELISEFSLRRMSEPVWERKRNEFLARIEEIGLHEGMKKSEKVDPNKNSVEKLDDISYEAQVILAYAAKEKGEVICALYLAGKRIILGDITLTQSATPGQTASFVGAVNALEKMNYLRRPGPSKEYYLVTDEGYKAAEKICKTYGIDTSRDIWTYLNR